VDRIRRKGHPAKRLWAQAMQQRRHKRPARPGEPHPSPARPAFQDTNLVAEDQDLGGFVPVAQRKQAQSANRFGTVR
jgi:hypothetical protein